VLYTTQTHPGGFEMRAKLQMSLYLSLLLSLTGTSLSALSQGRQVAYLTPSLPAQSLRESAEAAYQAMNFDVALEQYKMLSQSAVAKADDSYWIGESYFHMNRFPEAVQAFEDTIAKNPRADNVRVRLVQTYISGNQPQVAKQKCTEFLACASDPSAKQQLLSLSRFCDSANHPVHNQTCAPRIER
jgi:predicted Zn-dependent protease